MADDSKRTDADGDNQNADLSRREMLKLGAGAAIAATLIGLDGKAVAEASQSKAPLFFTKEEFALLDELTELIIPTDEHSPGARAAQVASYIDFRLSESFEEEPKTVWRAGLKLIEQVSQEMNGKSFLEASLEQRIALLTRISQNEAKPVKAEEVFFNELKSSTADAYYSSKIGIHKEMEYKGNKYLKEFVGFDAT